MTQEEIERWATAYIEASQIQKIGTDHPLWWAIEQFMGVGDYQPTADERWKTIIEILRRDPPRSMIGNLAAGPLEDLIHGHGPEVIERIEIEARRDPAFRYLLGGVWESSTPEIWDRVRKARGKSWDE